MSAFVACGVITIIKAPRRVGERREQAVPHRNHGCHLGFVHAEFVVPARDNSFKTITIDRGTITGVSGSTVSLREGTIDATYKTVDIALGDDALIVVNGHKASAGDLQADMKAQITRKPNHTFVFAFGPR
jgi:hypothetical protein